MDVDEWLVNSDAAVSRSLQLAGANMLGVYVTDGPIRNGDEGSSRQYFLATDLGLALMTVRIEAGKLKAVADWTAWPDVIEPELRTDVLMFDEGIHETIRLTIQMPRVDVSSGTNLESLRSFGSAVMTLSRRR